MRATAADRAHLTNPILISIVGWLVPGAGHLWQGRTQKGLVFLVAIPLMFAVGLWLHGRLFPFELSQPLVALAAFASLGNGLPYFVAKFGGPALNQVSGGIVDFHVEPLGQGVVTAATYEYGNTFLIVAGLLNMLVALDAYDIALGRK